MMPIGSGDRTVRVWDPEAGAAVATRRDHNGRILKVITFQGEDGRVRVSQHKAGIVGKSSASSSSSSSPGSGVSSKLRPGRRGVKRRLHAVETL
jgi:hypothetical protein